MKLFKLESLKKKVCDVYLYFIPSLLPTSEIDVKESFGSTTCVYSYTACL